MSSACFTVGDEGGYWRLASVIEGRSVSLDPAVTKYYFSRFQNDLAAVDHQAERKRAVSITAETLSHKQKLFNSLFELVVAKAHDRPRWSRQHRMMETISSATFVHHAKTA